MINDEIIRRRSLKNSHEIDNKTNNFTVLAISFSFNKYMLKTHVGGKVQEKLIRKKYLKMFEFLATCHIIKSRSFKFQ